MGYVHVDPRAPRHRRVGNPAAPILTRWRAWRLRLRIERQAHATVLEHISHQEMLRKFGYLPEEALYRVRRAQPPK